MESIRLTDFSKGVGCGCKISPQILNQLLSGINFNQNNPNLLVGNQTNDDAAVYLLNKDQAVIATTDFFVPIVDDPYLFGQIAAANAISDVYAMGGKPLMALAILAWPIDKLPIDIANTIMTGANDTCSKANIVLCGGHTIDSDTPIFGLAVNGFVHPNQIKKNNTPQLGDNLYLTKPIGTGIITTALKKNLIDFNELISEFETIKELNKFGEICGALDYIHAMTDITGFGLIGHLSEMMANSSQLTALIHFNQIPIFTIIDSLINKPAIPDATYRNWNTYQNNIQIDPKVDIGKAFKILPDPQTNGGLLISVSSNQEKAFMEVISKNSFPLKVTKIGEIVERTDKSILVQQ